MMIVLIISIIFFLSKTISFSVENDSVPLPGRNYNQLSNTTEIDCYKVKKVLFQGACQELLTSSACRGDDEWLVLDYRSAILPNPVVLPKCVKKPCTNKKYYWPDDGECYSNSSEGNPCPKGKELENNVFGEGVCQCIAIPPHESVNDGTCHQLYTRGPCEHRSVFVKSQNRVQCIPDKCYSKTASSVNKTYVFWEKTQKCYPLDERGPCERAKSLKIHPRLKIPTCSDLALPTHLVDLPQSCSTDHEGKCNDNVNINSDEGFVTSVLLQADKKRKSKHRQ